FCRKPQIVKKLRSFFKELSVPRLLGVDIPNDKKVTIALTYLYGVGPRVAREVCVKNNVGGDKPSRDLDEDELSRLSTMLERDYMVEGPQRRSVTQNINRWREIKCYRGLRHRMSLPV